MQEYKKSALLTTRFFQVISLAITVTGFIWSTSDLLLEYVLVESAVTPLSVLFMVYGFMGSVMTELIARWISKHETGTEKKE